MLSSNRPEHRWSLPDVLASRPAVRVNQLGYLPGGPSLATWVTERREPEAFALHRPDGSVALRGTSQPWPVRPEPTSGLAVHVLDLSGLTQPGGYEVAAAGERSHPFRVAPDLYDRLADDALGVLHLLRSGWEVDGTRFPGYGRPAGHLGVPPNRGDTAVPAWSGPDAERLYPGWRPTGSFDVSGGWYDAGDYGKYVVSGAVAVWQLLGVVELLRTRVDATAGGREAAVLDECRWQLDWLLRMQVPRGQPLAGMAFHRVHGTEWSPLPGWAHEDPTVRVLHRPSTAATLHLAAVAAKAARLFRPVDPRYAERLLAAARTAHAASRSLPVLLAPAVARSPTTTASSPTSSQRVVACRTWPASSRGGSPTRRWTAGGGARTVASSTTSSSWRRRTS